MASGTLFDVCIPNGRCASGTARIFANASWKQISCRRIQSVNMCHISLSEPFWIFITSTVLLPSLVQYVLILGHCHPFPSIPIRSLDMWPVLSWIPSDRSCWSLAAPGSVPHGARRRWSSWSSWGLATPWREASSSSAPQLQHCSSNVFRFHGWGTKWVWFDWLVLWCFMRYIIKIIYNYKDLGFRDI